jgi:hypothetical protein
VDAGLFALIGEMNGWREVQVFDLSDNRRIVFDAANHNWQRILRCCIENHHVKLIKLLHLAH